MFKLPSQLSVSRGFIDGNREDVDGSGKKVKLDKLDMSLEEQKGTSRMRRLRHGLACGRVASVKRKYLYFEYLISTIKIHYCLSIAFLFG